jgi:transglutaminase-like putative cysteine protease
LHTNTALTGFADGLNPGAFSEMRQSRRTAFVATFPENSPVPPAGSLYWRGQSLENNHGLRWSRLEARPLPQVGQPATWWYSLQAMPGHTVFLLDVPLSITVSGSPLSLQEPSLGTTAGKVEAESSAAPANDPPDPRFAGGDLDVPKHIAEDGRLRALQKEAFPAGRDVRENLASLARFFKSSGFSYSMKFGRMSSDDVAGFLCGQRTGGCGHYAAASANLLRLAGIPARVVTGFRGGRWNPWLREITVRDSDAHAWVEAWDPAGRHWIRFDPTDFVAPELMLQVELERNPERWSWHMLAAAFVENAWSHSTRSIAPAMAAAAVLALGVGVCWVFLGRRTRMDPAQTALARMEKYAARRNLGRLPEETPLAWLARLQRTIKQNNSPQLKRFAAAYEQAVYSRTGLDAQTRSELRSVAHSFGHRGSFD